MLGENTKLDKYVKRTIFISGIGSFGNDGERSFPESSTQKRETSEQHFPCRKKGWRELNSDKFKKSQKIHFLRPFQNERSVFSKILSRKERLAMQDRSQGDIFFSFPQQKLSNVCHISLVRQSTLIYLPILRNYASTKKFLKIIKSLSRPLKTGQHLNHYSPRRYVANGKDLTRYSHGERQIDFFIATFGFYDLPQKISSK